MINRCTTCGSWFDLRKFPACPICGRANVPMASPAPQFQLPRFSVDHEAAHDKDIAGWTLPVGILLGLAGPFALYKASEGITGEIVVGFLVMLAVVAVFGAGASSQSEPARFAAGRVARTALMTIAITIAVVAVIGVAIFVLAFVACATSGF
ncbi:MAG: hypothetical protein AAB074_21730 [Planctomycetota bacterium]